MEIILALAVLSIFLVRKETKQKKKRITMTSCELISRTRPNPNTPSYKLKMKPENCKIELRFDNGMKVISRDDGRELHKFYQRGGVSSIIGYCETEVYLFNWRLRTFKSLRSLQISYKKLNLDKYKVSNF